VCATWGGGSSQACVVDVGAQKTSVTCIEDGLILPASRYLAKLVPYSQVYRAFVFRINIKYGGDDAVFVLYQLLMNRTNFPYKECDLSRSYDRIILEHLYESFCTLREVSPNCSFQI
jgi:actin-related protein 8